MKLLTVENAKTIKGESLGYLTGILYLAPANESGVMNVCPMATAGCMADCLYTAGRGVFQQIKDARIKKTKWLATDRAGFVAQLRKDIVSLARKAERDGLTAAVRVNGTSDLAWLAMQMAGEFPAIQFYDYTKLPKPWQRVSPNYHLAFSLSESNFSDAMLALEHGVNVAVVFNTKKGQPLPETWNGYTVIDGDHHDLRFLDDRGVIVGLRAKGKARKSVTGFVQIASLTGAQIAETLQKVEL